MTTKGIQTPFFFASNKAVVESDRNWKFVPHWLEICCFNHFGHQWLCYISSCRWLIFTQIYPLPQCSPVRISSFYWMLCSGCVVSILQMNEQLRCWLIIPGRPGGIHRRMSIFADVELVPECVYIISAVPEPLCCMGTRDKWCISQTKCIKKTDIAQLGSNSYLWVICGKIVSFNWLILCWQY